MIKPDRWKPSGGLVLEPNALAAATETTRSVALTAGPGSGKTEMLAQRADFLLRTGACRYPQRVLAISFKVDAARNLKARVRQRCGRELAARLDSFTFHAFAKRLIDRFRPVLTGADALSPDYTIGDQPVAGKQITLSDLVPLAIEILEASAVVRNAVRQTYSHVFLDEFQDCTSLQYRLVRKAFLGTDVLLTAVGDTKQRIMGWAGALEGVFRHFATDFSALPLNLYQNFRSLPRLRRMQNAMVKVMDPQAAVPDAELAGEGGTADVRDFENSDDEAKSLAELVQAWISEEGVPPSEIAVLISKQPELYADRVMSELARVGIPFRNEQTLQDLSAEPVSRLIVDFLTVILAERAPDAFGRLMDVLVTAGLDDDASYESRAEWGRFVDAERGRIAKQGVAAVTGAEIRRMTSSLIAHLGLERLAALSADYEQGPRLQELVSQTLGRIDELMSINPDPVRALARFSEDSAVRVMTIHKSKGLEFDTVVVLGVERETFWGSVDTERSAFFVGISRAKRRLLLTYSQHRERPAGARRWDEDRTPHDEFLGYVQDSA